MPGGARTQLTFFADRVADASYHPHSGDYFLFRKDVGGGEWFQIFRFDVATGDVTMLTDGKSRNTEFVWSNKGDRIAYASTRRNNADLDFYVMDPSDKPERQDDHGEPGRRMAGATTGLPTTARCWRSNGVSINESYLWLVDVATGAKKTAHARRARERSPIDPIGFSRDGKGIYVTTDKDNEFLRLAYMDLATEVAEVPHQLQMGRREWRRSPRTASCSLSCSTKTA